MNIRIDPDTNLRPQPAAPADTTAADGGWAELATGALSYIPGWAWAAALATLMAATAVTLPIVKKQARKAGRRAAGHTSTTDRRDKALLIASLTPSVTFWLAVLLGSARGLVAFGRDDLRWVDGWEYLVPFTLDGIGIAFGVLAFRAIKKHRNPDRAVRVAWAAMGASSAINFFHESGLAEGSWLGGAYLALMSVFAMLIFHELLDQFEQGADTIVRSRPKFGLRWFTYTPNTVCAALAWINHPPVQGTPATVAAAVEHLEHVRDMKRTKRATRLTPAPTPLARILPWIRVAQLDAALTEQTRSARAEHTAIADQITALNARAEQAEHTAAEALRQAEQYAEQYTVLAAERATEQATGARTEQELERLRRQVTEQSERIAQLLAEQAKPVSAPPNRSNGGNGRTSGNTARTGAKLTDEQAVALMLKEHPEHGYEWGSREVHRLTGAGFGRIPKLIAAVAEHHARSGGSERPERSDSDDAEHAGAAVSA